MTPHIDALLGDAMRTPLEVLAERFPEVAVDTLDEVGRRCALSSRTIAGMSDGRVALR